MPAPRRHAEQQDGDAARTAAAATATTATTRRLASEGQGRRDCTSRPTSEKRQAVRQLYRKLDPTKEWAENNYYKLPIDQQIADLVPVSPFWLDYARHDGKSPFLSQHLGRRVAQLHRDDVRPVRARPAVRGRQARREVRRRQDDPDARRAR